MNGCIAEVEERVITIKRGESEVIVQQKLLVQKKIDHFDRAAVDRVMSFSAKQAAKFESQNAVNAFKEGVPFNPAHHTIIKQKLLYNKEKKLLKKIEEMLADQSQPTGLVASTFTRTRVKIPDVVYFEEDLVGQKEKLYKIILTAYELSVTRLLASKEADADKTSLDRARPHPERVFRLNDKGELNNYIMLFFISEPLANLFCAEICGKKFNRGPLRAEVLPNTLV